MSDEMVLSPNVAAPQSVERQASADEKSPYEQLSPPHQAFVDQYFLLGQNQTQAYLAVYGGTYEYAAANASRLIKHDKIQAAIQAERAVLQARTGLSKQKILREYARLAFANLGTMAQQSAGFQRLDQLSEDDQAALQELTETVKYGKEGAPQRSRKVKLGSKTDALAALTKLLGIDKEVEGPRHPDINLSITVGEGSKASVDATPSHLKIELAGLEGDD